MQQRFAHAGAPDLDLGDRRPLVPFHQDQVAGREAPKLTGEIGLWLDVIRTSEAPASRCRQESLPGWSMSKL